MKSARYTLCLILAIVIVLTLTTFTAYSQKRGALSLSPLLIPSPSQSTEIPCGGNSIFIARSDYWPRAGDTHYIARFEAEGGPGRVFLRTSTEADVHLDLPANSPPTWYTLDLEYPELKDGGGVIELLFGGSGPSCTHRPDSRAVHVRSLNIFVSP